MRWAVTVRDGRDARRDCDLLLEATPDTPVDDVLPLLTRALGNGVDRTPIWIDGVRVPSGAGLRAAGLVAGSVITLHENAGPARGLGGVAELRIAAGRGAGRIHRLPLGRTLVGHDADGLSLPDDQLPADALQVSVAPDGTVRVEAADGVAAWCEGSAVPTVGQGRLGWPPHACVSAADTVLQLHPISAKESLDGPRAQLDVVRAPRFRPPAPTYRFVLPAEPVGSGRRGQRRSVTRWQARTQRVEATIADALNDERTARREQLPDPASCLVTVLGPGRRLWERRREDDDYLLLRLGVATRPSRLRVEVEGASGSPNEVQRRMLDALPVEVDLRRIGVLGVAGDSAMVAAVATWLVGQCAADRSPRDLRIAVLTTRAGAGWSWVRWLPHARVSATEPLPVLVGTDPDSLARRIAELGALVQRRYPAQRTAAPDVVAVLDGARQIGALPGVSDLLRLGPEVGVHLICLEDDERSLPQECGAVVGCGPRRIRLRESLAAPIGEIVPDAVDPAWAIRLGRALAPLRDVTQPDGNASARESTPGAPLAWSVPWEQSGLPAQTWTPISAAP